MAASAPHFTLLVPGPFASIGALADALVRGGLARPVRRDDGALVAGEVGLRLVDDPSLAEAFERGVGCDAGLLTAITRAGRAALLDVAVPWASEPRAVRELVEHLAAAGALAVRFEGSGTAWSCPALLEQLQSDSLAAAHRAAVVFVRDEDVVFSCGMHQLGLPDAEVAAEDPRAAVALLQSFQLFQLIDRPLLATGHTFAPDASSPRRALERWPDGRHHVSDGRHNPFGLFRLQPPGVPPRASGGLVLVPIPTLVALLMAKERELGVPLGRGQVEAIARGAVTMAMPLARAIELERARGHADIDPELAFEQWSIVRATHD
jgi:hypothetical protein